MLQWLYMYIASVCFMLQEYVFKCFKRIFQVFYLDVTEVDLDVA
jgi:hypothetical protein